MVDLTQGVQGMLPNISTSGLLKGLLITLVVILVLGFLGYYLWYRMKKKIKEVIVTPKKKFELGSQTTKEMLDTFLGDGSKKVNTLYEETRSFIKSFGLNKNEVLNTQ